MTRRAGLLAVVIVLVILAALPVLTYPPGRDQGEFATIASGILDGKTPYTELWNPKPPAVFYVYALFIGLFGPTAAALRFIDILLGPAVMALLFGLGGRITASWRVGYFAALLFGVFYFTESFWTLSQNDGIVLLPMTLAMVAVYRAADSPSPLNPLSMRERGPGGAGRGAIAWAALAGALAAYVMWFKYPFALFAVVLVVSYIVLIAPDWSRLIGPGLAFTGGGLAVGLGGVIALASMGALDALIESARVTSLYTALTFNAAAFSELLGRALETRWQHWGLLFLLAALWFVLGRVGEPRCREWLPVLFWLLAGAFIMLAQAKAYDYHWLPMLPPLILMAADTLDRAIDYAARNGLARRSGVPAALLVTLIGLVIMVTAIWSPAWYYLTGREDQMAYYGRFQGGEYLADESLAVATYLRERTTPGDSLYIWGFRPEVYYLARLNPPTRFIFQFPLVGAWYPEAWRKENVELLWAALPPYTLVLQADYLPWVTGRDADSNTLLQEYTELNNWLMFNYEPEIQIGNFFIWRRK